MTQELTPRNISMPQQKDTQEENKPVLSVKNELMRSADERVQKLKKVDQGSLFRQISAIITLFCQSLNVNQNMSVQQVANLTRDLIDDCPDWTIDDFTLFFKGCLKGLYGEIRFSIDQPKVYEMKALYEEQRSIEREKIVSQRKDFIEKERKEVDPEIIEQIYKKLEKKK